jgi:hypothetical protein
MAYYPITFQLSYNESYNVTFSPRVQDKTIYEGQAFELR